LNKGMFDVSAGLGPTYMPDPTVRVGFDTRRMNVPEKPEKVLIEKQFSAAELERDRVINQYRESNPFWYREGIGMP
jgi:hypothetical protein